MASEKDPHLSGEPGAKSKTDKHPGLAPHDVERIRKFHKDRRERMKKERERRMKNPFKGIGV